MSTGIGPESGGLSIEKAEGKGVNLGSFNEVSDLMGQFAGAVAAIWQGFTNGDTDQGESMAELKALASSYAAIWKGEEPGYAIAPWRTPPVLAGKICAWLPGVDPTAAIEGYFLWLGKQVLRGCQEVTDGMAVEQAGPMLAEIMKDAAEKLSGVQP